MSRLLHVLCCSATLMLTACATTTFTSTWKAPDAQGVDPTGKKVAAVYMSSNESSRRAAEDVSCTHGPMVADGPREPVWSSRCTGYG